MEVQNWSVFTSFFFFPFFLFYQKLVFRATVTLEMFVEIWWLVISFIIIVFLPVRNSVFRALQYIFGCNT